MTTKTKPDLWDRIVEGERRQRRKKVDAIDVADGGYLTWLYGSSYRRMGSWPPDFLRHAVVMMDSQTNNRRDRSPHYKQDRIDRRNANEQTYETWRQVKSFQELVQEDPRVKFITVPGCEADDLVAIAAWKFGDPDEPLKVFGQDKDLLQIGDYFTIVNKDGEAVTLDHFQERLPKALHGSPLEAWQIPIVLALLGDKSDSVPRFLPRGIPGLNRLGHILWGTARPWDEFAEMFPEAIPNLYDVLLPDPGLLEIPVDGIIEVMRSERWSHELLAKLPPKLKREVRSWTLRSSLLKP